MIVETSRHFDKDIDKLDAITAMRVLQVIEFLITVTDIQDIPNMRKMQGTSSAYRIKIGDYRIGIVLDDTTISLHRVLHRSKIYRNFP
jgi:mRNA interferase RelE/StbE